MTNSKQKGSSFERVVCKRLSQWVTDGKRDDCFWRAAMSGGRATVAHRKGQDVRQCGDIAPVAHEGNKFCELFYTEVKHYKNLNFGSLITGANGPATLLGIWNKTRVEAQRYGRIPLLIARQNNWPTLLLTDTEGSNELYLLSKRLVHMKFYPSTLIALFDKVMDAPSPLALNAARIRKIEQ